MVTKCEYTGLTVSEHSATLQRSLPWGDGVPPFTFFL